MMSSKYNVNNRMGLSKKKIFIIIGSVVAVLLVIGGILLWMVWQSTPSDTPSGKNDTKGATPQYTQPQDLVNDVNKKYGSGDYKGAIALIEAQKDSGTDVNLQLLLAGAYANSGDLKKAFEIYKKLSDEGKLPDTELANYADMAERAGDVQAAIAAYKKAKEYAVSSKKIGPDEIAVYDYKISQLEKK